jgi:hypothetical protein
MLAIEEETWRLKIHVIWLEEGDNNTKLFHKFVEHRKVLNTIWELEGPDGKKLKSFRDIVEGGEDHFKSIFKEREVSDIGEQMEVIRLFPRFFLSNGE